MTKKSADQWFAEYGESHRHPTNKLVHWICVPAIVASLIAMIWDIPVPSALRRVPFLNWATLLVAVSLVFYVRLSIPLAIGMLLFNTAIVVGILAYQQAGFGALWKSALGVLVVAWIGQFFGHKIEGKKPSFLQDLQFLLIGPVWLLGFIYRKLGIRY
jgi:uncharacterized membrane protein YGL010W